MSISVLMTTYNCGKYISQSVKSILNQTFNNFELIIIDDGSEDNTSEVLDKIIDNRINYFKIEHVGRSAALNIAFSKSNFNIVAFQDADDISHPKRLEIQLKSLNFNNEIIFTRYAFFKDSKILYVNPPNNEIDLSKEKFILHGHFNNSSSMFYKSLLLNAGGFNEKLSVFEDYDFWLRVSGHASFKITPEVLHFTRERQSSISQNNNGQLNKLIYDIQSPYYLQNIIVLNSLKVNKNNIKGWREFFYGDKNLARKYWNKSKFYDLNYKMILAYILSFLPNSKLNKIKRLRLRLRINYLLNRNRKFRKLNIEFNNLLFELSK